ncbi:hypothetical protein CCMA1212_004740 [Trichoderma ghanense]|uniref:Uncharacterized protein n=1 Tax=Trichoderma ghanense TaxID=65468 RepID=A0ABY2H714_9HYPO
MRQRHTGTGPPASSQVLSEEPPGLKAPRASTHATLKGSSRPLRSPRRMICDLLVSQVLAAEAKAKRRAGPKVNCAWYNINWGCSPANVQVAQAGEMKAETGSQSSYITSHRGALRRNSRPQANLLAGKVPLRVNQPDGHTRLAQQRPYYYGRLEQQGYGSLDEWIKVWASSTLPGGACMSLLHHTAART